MKLKNFSAILSITCAFAAVAHAAPGKSHQDASIEQSLTSYNFVTVKGGLVNPTPLGGNTGLNDGSDTYTLGLAMGRKFQDRFVLELEYMFRGKNTSRAYNANSVPNQNNTNWKVSSNSFMVNAAVDLIEAEKFRPYFKAGAGISMNKSNDYVYTETTANAGTQTTTTYTYAGKKVNSFAWQVGAGANMKTSEMFDTQLQYMYVDRGDVKTKPNYYQSSIDTTVPSNAIRGRMKEHVITIGLTMKF